MILGFLSIRKYVVPEGQRGSENVHQLPARHRQSTDFIWALTQTWAQDIEQLDKSWIYYWTRQDNRRLWWVSPPLGGDTLTPTTQSRYLYRTAKELSTRSIMWKKERSWIMQFKTVKYKIGFWNLQNSLKHYRESSILKVTVQKHV